MATTEMIRSPEEGAPHDNAALGSLAGGSSMEDAQSQHALGRSPVDGNDGRLGVDYAAGEQFE